MCFSSQSFIPEKLEAESNIQIKGAWNCCSERSICARTSFSWDELQRTQNEIRFSTHVWEGIYAWKLDRIDDQCGSSLESYSSMNLSMACTQRLPISLRFSCSEDWMGCSRDGSFPISIFTTKPNISHSWLYTCNTRRHAQSSALVWAESSNRCEGGEEAGKRKWDGGRGREHN